MTRGLIMKGDWYHGIEIESIKLKLFSKLSGRLFRLSLRRQLPLSFEDIPIPSPLANGEEKGKGVRYTAMTVEVISYCIHGWL